jgi:hypothetical protein
MINKDYVKIIHKDKSLPTVISFSSVNTPKGSFKPYRIVEEADINIIFVNDKGNRWYQNGIEGISDSSEAAAIELVEKAREIGNGHVITFGTSMGAFGAILFAILGKADGCLAFGVESRLLEKGSRSYQYLDKNIKVEYPDLRPLIEGSNVEILLFASENDELDLISLYHLLQIKNLKGYTVTGVDHPGVQAFDIKGNVGEIITDYALSKLDIIDFERKGHILIHLNVIPVLYRAFQIKNVQKNYTEWLSYMEEHKDKFQDNPIFMLRLGEARYKNNNNEGAVEAWARTIDLSKYEFESRAKLGAILRRRKEYNKAIEILRESVEINPWHAHGYHTLGLAYKDTKQMVKAEENLRTAIDINKGNKNFKKSLADFLIEDAKQKISEAHEILINLC